MRLLNISTVNFKKLGTFAAKFTDGLNVIAGDNARGKSTLLQAIETALFGSSVVPGKKENIPTWGQNKFSVELSFHVAPHTYLVTRTGTAAKLLRLANGEASNDEIVANGNTAVTAHIEDLLGLAARDWNLFVQSKQGESSGILTFGATALNRKVEEFAGVELIEKVQAEAQRRYTLHNSYAEIKQVSLEDVQALEDSVAETQKLVDAAVQRETDAEQAFADHPEFTLQKPALSSTVARDQQRAVERASNAVDVAQGKHVSAQGAVKAAAQRAEAVALQDAEALKEDLQQLHDDGTIARDEMTTLRTQQQAHTTAQTALTKADAMFDGTNDEFQSKFREFDEQALRDELGQNDSVFPTLRASIESASEAVGKAKAAYDNLVGLADGAVCPTCNRAKDDHDPEKLKEEAYTALLSWEQAKNHVAKLRDDLQLVLDRRLQIVAELADFDRLAKKVDEASAALDLAKAAHKAAPSVAGELKAAEEGYETLRTQYAAKQQQIKGVEENNERFHAEQRALAKAESELEICEDTLKEAMHILDELPEPPTDAEILAIEQEEAAYQQAMSEWKEQRTALQGGVNSAVQNLTHQNDLLAIAKNNLAKAVEKNLEAKDDAALAKKYGRLVQFLRTKRQDYMQEVWATVMGVSSKLVNQSSKGLITKLENEDGDFTFEEDGVMAPTSSASGAQKAFIGTSMRIGLGRALYGSDSLLIFDEPTESCSEHNAGSMAAMIASSAKQVLLITHRETDQALADHIINVGE